MRPTKYNIMHLMTQQQLLNLAKEIHKEEKNLQPNNKTFKTEPTNHNVTHKFKILKWYGYDLTEDDIMWKISQKQILNLAKKIYQDEKNLAPNKKTFKTEPTNHRNDTHRFKILELYGHYNDKKEYAKKLQSTQRGISTRARTARFPRYYGPYAKNKATKIQAVVRGSQARGKTNQTVKSTRKELPKEITKGPLRYYSPSKNKYITKIQAATRGSQARTGRRKITKASTQAARSVFENPNLRKAILGKKTNNARSKKLQFASFAEYDPVTIIQNVYHYGVININNYNDSVLKELLEPELLEQFSIGDIISFPDSYYNHNINGFWSQRQFNYAIILENRVKFFTNPGFDINEVFIRVIIRNNKTLNKHNVKYRYMKEVFDGVDAIKLKSYNLW